MKLLSVLAMSATLLVPFAANAKVSTPSASVRVSTILANSPTMPFPRPPQNPPVCGDPIDRGCFASSPALPFPRNLGTKGSLVAASPALPFPRNLGTKGSIVAASPALPFPRNLGTKGSLVAASPALPFPRNLGTKGSIIG